MPCFVRRTIFILFERRKLSTDASSTVPSCLYTQSGQDYITEAYISDLGLVQ